MNLDTIALRARQMSEADLALEIHRLECARVKALTLPTLRLLIVTLTCYQQELKRRRLDAAPEVPSMNRSARWLPRCEMEEA